MTARLSCHHLLLRPVSLPTLVLLLFVLDMGYTHLIRSLPVTDSIRDAIPEALIYTLIFWITVRIDLAKLTISYLALPYFIFIPGWLNTPTATGLLVIVFISLLKTLQQAGGLPHRAITWRDVGAFTVILIWVNLSGAGGYGFQWPDYNIHNARLHDLIVNDWPIRYSENKNFVYYFGYFLPAALLGKFTTVATALRSQYAWTVLGITLAIRWLSQISHWRFSIATVIVFALFGPFDILNIAYVAAASGEPVIHSVQTSLLNWQDHDLFVTGYHLGFFLGNYLSNTFELYWSPQQIIAGWIGVGIITDLFLKNKLQSIIFIYALLCLWAPLVMIALLPFIALILMTSLRTQTGRTIFSFENTIGTGSLAMVFIVFYLGGSAATNPSYWLFEAIDWSGKIMALLLFLLFGWGIYIIATLPFILQADRLEKIWFGGLVIALVVLPLRIFGQWNDLLCRGSAPLMFLVLAFLLRAIQHYWISHCRIRALLLMSLLLPGTIAALQINRVAIAHYGQTQPVNSVISYSNAYPNLGPDDSIFNRYLRREPKK